MSLRGFRPLGITLFASGRARTVFAAVVQRDDQQRLDNRPRVICLNHDEPAFADGDHFWMRDGQRPAVGQTNTKRLKWLPPQRFSSFLHVHLSHPCTDRLKVHAPKYYGLGRRAKQERISRKRGSGAFFLQGCHGLGPVGLPPRLPTRGGAVETRDVYRFIPDLSAVGLNSSCIRRLTAGEWDVTIRGPIRDIG